MKNYTEALKGGKQKILFLAIIFNIWVLLLRHQVLQFHAMNILLKYLPPIISCYLQLWDKGQN